MFKFFRKKPEKLTDFDLAMRVLNWVQSFQEVTQQRTTAFIEQHPAYSKDSRIIRAEIQWVVYIAGILAVWLNTSTDRTKRVISEVEKILKSGNVHAEQSPNFILAYKDRIDSYFSRFNRAFLFGDYPQTKYSSQTFIEEILKDCANEGIYFFTEENRDMDEFKSYIFQNKLEPRKSWGELGKYVEAILSILFWPIANGLGKDKQKGIIDPE